jgi:hypothetical protein
MDVAPAAVEVAVVTGAVVQGGCACSSMQQQRRGCGSKQRALVEPQAVVDKGTIAMDDGRQPACVRQLQQMWHACNSMQRSGVCAATCSYSGMCVAAGESSQQHDCNETVMAAGRGGGTKSSS